MDILEYIASYGPWAWVVGGLVLLGIELVMPGGVFVWFGLAGVVTGLVSFVVPMDWAWQGALFGVLSLSAVALWQVFKPRGEPETDNPHLNARAARLIGQRGFLSEPIVGQVGRMELGESVWRVTGPNLPAGHLVEIVGHKGAMLEVKSASDTPPVGVA